MPRDRFVLHAARRLANKDARWGLAKSGTRFVPGVVAYRLGDASAYQIRIVRGREVTWEDVGVAGPTWDPVPPVSDEFPPDREITLRDLAERLDKMIELLQKVAVNSTWLGN